MSARNPLFLRNQELDRSIELLYEAVRALDGASRPLLDAQELGRVHHAVLHLVVRRPGRSVTELQTLLGISKQTMSRVAQHLVARGLLDQIAGDRDRRQRLLGATETGREFVERLDGAQRCRVAAAFRAAGPEAVSGFQQVLAQLLVAREGDDEPRNDVG